MSKNKKIGYSIIIFILIVLFILTSYLLIYFFNNRDISIKKEYINVIDSDSINYTIKLKDNDFISDSSKVDAYAIDMIEYLNIYYKFNSKFSDLVDGSFNTHVEGTLIGTSKVDNSTVLYNKFLDTLDEDKINGEILNYNNEYKLDFIEVKKIFDSFIDVNKLDLNGIIKFDVTLSYKVYNELINDYVDNSVTLNLSIPLVSDTRIDTSKTYERNENIYAKMPPEQKSLYLAICLELFGALVLFVIIFILIINQMKSTYSKYEKLLDNLLRKKKGKLIKLKTLPDFSERDVKLVKSFKDLEKVSLYRHIYYVEVIPNKLTVFFINDGGITNVYNFDSRKVGK